MCTKTNRIQSRPTSYRTTWKSVPKYIIVCQNATNAQTLHTLAFIFEVFFLFLQRLHRRRYKQGKSPKHPKHQNRTRRTQTEKRTSLSSKTPTHSLLLNDTNRTVSTEQTAREDCESSARPTRRQSSTARKRFASFERVHCSSRCSSQKRAQNESFRSFAESIYRRGRHE